MKSENSTASRSPTVSIIFACVLATAVATVATRAMWLPFLHMPLLTGANEHLSGHPEDDLGHEGHEGHAHDEHDDASSLHLSEQARRNIGLSKENLQPIKLRTFTRTLNIPALVGELPGHTQVQVASPMTGVISSVQVVQGEAIEPGTLLFKVRLTHEDLVLAQTAFLKTLGELDVEDREIARLTSLDTSGVIAGKRLLERQYSKQKLEAVSNANRESLLLHGLSSDQIDSIVRDRRLLRELEIRAPELPSHAPVSQNSEEPPHVFVVQKINVNTGSTVRAGDPMAILTDLDELYVVGRAFEHDAEEITHASSMQSAGKSDWDITAVLENNGHGLKTIEELKIVYVDNQVEADSRAQRFFVKLPNRVVLDTQTPDGHRFLTWRFKPGQRMQLRVPVEQWSKRFVLPVDAIASEGAETFVFLENGDHFDRRPVHVEHQDQLWVVIANDGSLFPGDTVALTGAHQMQVALKNKAGGGVDPHAGHNH